MKKLTIPSGKLVFVIGKSGIGKSTFIETLGLMNNTMVNDNTTKVEFGVGEGKTIELRGAWNMPNSDMSDLRKKYFSFIFQNTNLMPNFTAGENMMTSLLIEGKEITEAKKKVLEVMGLLSLPQEIFDRKTTELSGGQRQRLAFVRAVISDFVVLFGDEPTGNLDEKTAADLMGVLKNLITKDQKTGIIVSHDLKLAHDFADIIIPLTAKMKDGEILHGEVNLENVMTNENGRWNNSSGEKIADPLQYFSQYLS
jgi:ABC-type lipoprotein export system ATPase subunit